MHVQKSYKISFVFWQSQVSFLTCILAYNLQKVHGPDSVEKPSQKSDLQNLTAVVGAVE